MNLNDFTFDDSESYWATELVNGPYDGLWWKWEPEDAPELPIQCSGDKGFCIYRLCKGRGHFVRFIPE